MLKTIKAGFSLWATAVEVRKEKIRLEKNLDAYEKHGVVLNMRDLSPKIRTIIREGKYEKAERKVLDSIVIQDETILEIGSGIGFLSLYLLNKGIISDCYLIEANPKTCELLRRNYRLNNRTPKLLNCAFAEKDTTVTFLTHKDFYEDRIVKGKSGDGVSVPAYSIESIIKNFAVSPSMIVMDVEGAELALTPSNTPQSVRKIVMEIHPRIVSYRQMYKHVLRFLEDGWEVTAQCGDVLCITRSC